MSPAAVSANERALADELVLSFLNSNDFTVTQLDLEVGLYMQAATQIFQFRAGMDFQLGTWDDRWFRSIAEVDALPQVGRSSLNKLRNYALQRQEGLPDDPDCLVISEYIEGRGYDNKALEIYNCSQHALALKDYGICVALNYDHHCSRTGNFGNFMLAPGAVYTLCRSTRVVDGDPNPEIADHCQQAMPAVLNFNGDDRIVLFKDINGSHLFDGQDRQMDALGSLTERMSGAHPFKDRVLRRCNLTPYKGQGPFYWQEYFNRYSEDDLEHFGQAPDQDEACYYLHELGPIGLRSL
jgi:hypothetical protein